MLLTTKVINSSFTQDANKFSKPLKHKYDPYEAV